MIDLHTLNYLTENIYSMNDGYDEEDLDYEISKFFSKLMKRRRNDDVEEGLQAGGVIFPDRAGFKISERDGRASHAQCQENISQYLNGESEFSSEEAVGFINQRKNDPNAWMNITKKGFTVRVVANEEMLIFVFNTYSYDVSHFQLEVIHKLLNLIRETYKNNEIKFPYINFVTGRDKFVFNENKDIDEQLDKLDNLIDRRLDELKEKTR